jgi:hypothetical protein
MPITRLNPKPFVSPLGIELALTIDHRHVRVLTLPVVCGKRRLREDWEACCAHEPHDCSVVWSSWAIEN